MVHARFCCRIIKTARKSVHQQRCRPHTTGGGTVEHKQIPWACHDGNICSQGLISRSRRGLRKQDSSYGPRGRSLGRRGQVSVPVNLHDHLVQSIALDMLYLMYFAHLR
ncbi:hypothetical protein TNCV_3095071 [Trichonephila clavipes]|nr:hypothetical protein TNCV_3095071 [Trichonephila clavipes]